MRRRDNMKMSEGVGRWWRGLGRVVGVGWLCRGVGGRGNCQVPTFIPLVVSLEFSFVSCTLQQMQKSKAALTPSWGSSSWTGLRNCSANIDIYILNIRVLLCLAAVSLPEVHTS